MNKGGRPPVAHLEYVEPKCIDGTAYDHSACFGRRLRMIMNKHGMNAVRIAELTGISASTIHTYIHRGSLPDIEKGYMIAYALKVDPRWLFGYINPKKEVKECK